MSTRSGMPCEPEQFKGCRERVEDQSSHEAPQARDSVQHVEAAVSQQQVQCVLRLLSLRQTLRIDPVVTAEAGGSSTL